MHMKKHVETRIELDGFFFAVLRIICIATTQNRTTYEQINNMRIELIILNIRVLQKN